MDSLHKLLVRFLRLDQVLETLRDYNIERAMIDLCKLSGVQMIVILMTSFLKIVQKPGEYDWLERLHLFHDAVIERTKFDVYSLNSWFTQIIFVFLTYKFMMYIFPFMLAVTDIILGPPLRLVSASTQTNDCPELGDDNVHKPNIKPDDDFRRAVLGTKGFAVVNIVFTGLASLFSVAGFFFWFVGVLLPDLTKSTRSRSDSDGLNFFFVYVLFALITISMVLSLTAFLFSCFLIHGIFKKNPAHIKAYFVYGVIVNVLTLSAGTLYAFDAIWYDPITVVCVPILCVIYAIILSQIRIAYRGYERNSNSYIGDKLLVVASDIPNKI